MSDKANETGGKTEKGEGMWSADRRRRTILILAAGAAAGVAITIFLLYDYHKAGMESEMALESLRGLEAVAIEGGQGADAPDGTVQAAAGAAGDVFRQENPYADVFREYPDIRAWLHVEGTAIDYPVLQREGDDEYYLYRNFAGEEDKRGSLILDEDSSVEDGEHTTNLLIHGHNMKDGSMFGGLDGYRSEDYYEEHSHMTLYTGEGMHEYEVIAVFESQIYYAADLVFKYYNFFQADTVEEFKYFYDNIRELSLYDTGVTAEFGDKFLTLSTCAYHMEDGRFVVVAKEIL